MLFVLIFKTIAILTVCKVVVAAKGYLNQEELKKSRNSTTYTPILTSSSRELRLKIQSTRAMGYERNNRISEFETTADYRTPINFLT